MISCFYYLVGVHIVYKNIKILIVNYNIFLILIINYTIFKFLINKINNIFFFLTNITEYHG